MRQGLLLLLGLVCAALARAETGTADALFAATLTGLDEQPAALAQWRGKPLVVNFWARWCGPCKAEIPEFIKLRKQYRAKGLEVLGIAVEERAEPVRDFAKAYEMDYPLLVAKDKGLPLMQALGNAKMGLPFTVVIDRSGKIVRVKLGAIQPDELNAAAEAALK